MSKYYVIQESTCLECSGTGIITHPLWQKFRQETGEAGRLWTEGEVCHWFEDHGYDTNDAWGLPDEEETCYECYGVKIVTRRVQLTAAVLTGILASEVY